MVTIKDIAECAGVSPGTVSRSLNNSPLISYETRQRVQAIAEELGYSKNELASGLSTGNLKVIGLIVSDIANPFYADVARGVEDVAQAHGFGMILCNTDEDPDKEEYYAQFLKTHRASGIILASSTMEDPVVQRIQEKLPIVLLSRITTETHSSYIVYDDVVGGRLATEHLIDLGHTRIGFIGGPNHVAPSWSRFRGYRKALEAHRLPYRKRRVRFGEFTQATGNCFANELIKQSKRPTAVFAANDLIALGVMEAAESQGLVVPDDLAVVGYDDITLARLPRIQLTTVSQSIREMGQLAADSLFELIEEPNRAPIQQVLEPQLVVRHSCGASEPGP